MWACVSSSASPPCAPPPPATHARARAHHIGLICAVRGSAGSACSNVRGRGVPFSLLYTAGCDLAQSEAEQRRRTQSGRTVTPGGARRVLQAGACSKRDLWLSLNPSFSRLDTGKNRGGPVLFEKKKKRELYLYNINILGPTSFWALVVLLSPKPYWHSWLQHSVVICGVAQYCIMAPKDSGKGTKNAKKQRFPL